MAMKSVPATIEDYLNRCRIWSECECSRLPIPSTKFVLKLSQPFNTECRLLFGEGKVFIHYAAYKKHLGIYPVPTSGTDLMDLFKGYKTSGKGTIQFPLAENLPVELLREIIRYRMDLINQKSIPDQSGPFCIAPPTGKDLF
ncbi:MAG: hypothetical protein H6561_16875 [Lewinellaceae bacterium]|nr:hypothetical protein [Lewinellaceae bacterium]